MTQVCLCEKELSGTAVNERMFGGLVRGKVMQRERTKQSRRRHHNSILVLADTFIKKEHRSGVLFMEESSIALDQ